MFGEKRLTADSPLVHGGGVRCERTLRRRDERGSPDEGVPSDRYLEAGSTWGGVAQAMIRSKPGREWKPGRDTVVTYRRVGTQWYERHMANLAQQSARDRQRLFGRLGGALLFGSGLVSLLTVPFPAPAGTIDRPALIVITAVAMVAGAFGWIAPWDRWRRRAVLWMLPVAFGLIAAGNYYGADSDPRSYGVFFVVAFVYLGVSQTPSIPLLMSPIAAAAYLTPLLMRGVP